MSGFLTTPPLSTFTTTLPATSAPTTSTPMRLDQLTMAITDFAWSVTDIYSHLSNMAAQSQRPMPPLILYGMPGYDTMLLLFQDVQPMVLPVLGVHSMVPLFQGVQASTPIPIH